jgi:hypothetical protein
MARRPRGDGVMVVLCCCANALVPHAPWLVQQSSSSWPDICCCTAAGVLSCSCSFTGYGFSSAPKEKGCGVTAIAGIMDSLMASLGYSRYIAQVGGRARGS